VLLRVWLSRTISLDLKRQTLEMSSLDQGFVRPLITADNKSSGSQFIADGHGDQNVAFGNSHQINDYSDRRNITSGLSLSSPYFAPVGLLQLVANNQHSRDLRFRHAIDMAISQRNK
jgi:hypothetical protein